MSHPKFVPDRIYNVAKIAAQIYQDEHLTGLEVITMSGEKLLPCLGKDFSNSVTK